ncbi:hypothetical protein ACVW00_000308 [Marmoricola sp. URHA0025 HA25]
MAVATIPLLGAGSAQAAWTGGDLVVYRVGSGSGSLSNAAAAVFLDRFHPDGSTAGTTSLPTTAANGNQPLTAAGLSRSEGLIATSPDGHYLTVTGYAAAPGTQGPTVPSQLTNGTTTVPTGLTSTDRNSTPRVVGIVDSAGNVDTTTALTGANAPTIIRSAVTDGQRFWATGDQSGIVGAKLGEAPTLIASGANLNGVTIQSGQLFTGGSLTNRLGVVGSGLPASSTSIAPLPLASTGLDGLPANLLSYGYAFVDRVGGTGYAGTPVDTLYVANASNRNGTLDKYSWNGSVWQPKGWIDVPGILGLVAHPAGSTVELAITTPKELLTKTDAASATSVLTAGAPTHLVDAPANTEFRGVALAPTGTDGPLLLPHLPAAGTAYTIGATIPVSATVIGTGATSVSFQLGSGPAAAGVHAGGNLWTATLPTAGLAPGAADITVTATDGTTPRVATSSVALASPAPPPPSVPAGAAPVGTYSWRNVLFVRKGAWGSFSTPYSPDHAGLVSATKGRTIRGTAYGTGLSLVFVRRPNAGKVAITIDGRTTVVDLYAKRAVRYLRSFSFAAGSHTFQIKVLGTKRAASKGKNVYAAAVLVR